LSSAPVALIAVPWIIGNEFYVNMASQVLIYALFALVVNMMLATAAWSRSGTPPISASPATPASCW
jgi:ABC-type branched-subunit amino acid transport system permease subunit